METRPSTTTVADIPTARDERVVGATALALAASVAVQSTLVIRAGAPSYADPMTDVLGSA